MTRRWAILAAVLLLAVPAAGQTPAPVPQISEHLALENESVRVTLLTFSPGAASGRHVGLEPELGMVIEGELTLVTDAPSTTSAIPAAPSATASRSAST